MNYLIKPSKLSGAITIPASKSHTLRAILFASLAHGESIIHNYLHSPDTDAMIAACRLLGAKIHATKHQLNIIGTNGTPQTPENIIDAGNSGQVLRFVAAVAALTSGYTIITGDESVRKNRPVQPLLDGLTHLHVFAKSSQNNATAPIIIQGPLRGGETTLNGEDSQPVSALLIAAAFATNPTVINVRNPGEKPWVDLTLSWLKRLGIQYEKQDYTQYKIMGNARYAGFEYIVPGDFSSCAFPLVAGLITNSAITLQNLDFSDAQGDKELICALQTMGANIEYDLTQKIITTHPIEKLIGQTIDVNNYIDAVPILAVAACFATSETLITGAAIARKKESNRLAAITQELQKMGANILELEDGLKIMPSKLVGAKVDSFNDHRIAMALAVAGMMATGETIITNVSCVEKSYPDFAQAMRDLGGIII
jgi:3-phosphoshikimate 1-carboxyvinyltransferase